MKPIYIEIDEEVTAIIDRVRAATTKDVVIVVPTGAALLQSAVNMRLLLREAQKAQKNLTLVTSDEYGLTLAQKVGITAHARVEDVAGMDMDAVQQSAHTAQRTIGTQAYFDDGAQHDAHVQQSAVHGDDDVYDGMHSTVSDVAASHDAAQQDSDRRERPVMDSAAPHVDVRASHTVQPPAQSTQPAAHVRNRHTADVAPDAPVSDGGSLTGSAAQTMPPALDQHKQREVKAFFGRARANVQETSDAHAASLATYAHVPDEMTASQGAMTMRWWVLAAALGAVAVALIIAAVIFLPRATVALTPQVREESVTVNVIADATVHATDFAQRTMPLIVLEKEEEITRSFEATGASAAGSFKARGTVTIYNTYSAAPQKLVATTRLLTKDGVLFRLVDSVVVPGMKKVDGKMVPGEVTAAVIADKPGEEYNIGPSEFSIPGFKGSPRYGKFYAKSTQPMIGGSTKGGEKRVVTADDLARAKKETEDAARAALMEALRADAAAQGKKVLDEMVRVEIVSSGTQVVEGVAASSFDYTVKVRAQAMVFSENDVVIMLRKALEEKVKDRDVKQEDLVVKYAPALADFEKRRAELTVRATARLVAQVDTAAVARALTGKRQDELDAALRSFVGIDAAEIRYGFGAFLNRLPYYSGSITVEIVQPQ